MSWTNRKSAISQVLRGVVTDVTRLSWLVTKLVWFQDKGTIFEEVSVSMVKMSRYVQRNLERR